MLNEFLTHGNIVIDYLKGVSFYSNKHSYVLMTSYFRQSIKKKSMFLCV